MHRSLHMQRDGNDDQDGLFASTVWDNDVREIIVKIVNTSSQPQKLALNFDGLKSRKVLTNGTCIQLRSSELTQENTLEQPNLIQPDEFPIQISGKTLLQTIPAHTFAIYKFKKEITGKTR